MAELAEAGELTKAIEKGIPKLRIEQAATKKQAKIDSIIVIFPSMLF